MTKTTDTERLDALMAAPYPLTKRERRTLKRLLAKAHAERMADKIAEEEAEEERQANSQFGVGA